MRFDVRRVQAEDGMALGMVLLAMVVLAGLSTVFVAVSIAETTGTGATRDFESTVHWAEAGAERVITDINVTPKNNYIGPDAHLWTSPADEKAWAIQIAESDPAGRVNGPNGQWGYGIRPHRVVGGVKRPLNVVYGVGRVNGAKGPRTRVVKMKIDVGMYTVAHAVLSNGSVKVDKNTVQITGTTANVHTNSSLAISSVPTIAGAVTACKPNPSPPCVGTTSNTNSGFIKPGGTAGTLQAAQAPLPVPGINAAEWYEKRFNYSGTWYEPGNPNGYYGTPDPTTYDGLWVDMCIRPGEDYATVQVPAPEGGVPCSGTYMTAWNAKQVVRLMPRVSCGSGYEFNTQPGGKEGGLYRGWHGHSSRWHLCHAPGDGIFFVVGGEPVDIDSNHPESAKVTILTDGAINVSGTRSFEPALEDLLFASEQPINISGGPHQLRGIVSTQQCATLKGTATLEGGVMAQGNCQTLISDNFDIHYDGGMRVPFGGITRIAAWNEL